MNPKAAQSLEAKVMTEQLATRPDKLQNEHAR
jgi:hypothetical protein